MTQVSPQIHPFDWSRVLFGGLPSSFLIEAVLRLVFLYMCLLIAFRMMGRRMSSQMTRNELMALTALAAAVGPALLDPAQGLLPPVIVSVCVVIVQRSLALLSFRYHAFENLAQGAVSVLVLDGRIDTIQLRRSQVSHDRLLAELRKSGVLNLAQVERMYFEPNGAFTVLRAQQPAAGLSLVPSWDRELADQQSTDPEHSVCSICGAVVGGKPPPQCSNCGNREFCPSVRS